MHALLTSREYGPRKGHYHFQMYTMQLRGHFAQISSRSSVTVVHILDFPFPALRVCPARSTHRTPPIISLSTDVNDLSNRRNPKPTQNTLRGRPTKLQRRTSLVGRKKVLTVIIWSQVQLVCTTDFLGAYPAQVNKMVAEETTIANMMQSPGARNQNMYMKNNSSNLHSEAQCLLNLPRIQALPPRITSRRLITAISDRQNMVALKKTYSRPELSSG